MKQDLIEKMIAGKGSDICPLSETNLTDAVSL
jgi:hypothetical protein